MKDKVKNKVNKPDEHTTRKLIKKSERKQNMEKAYEPKEKKKAHKVTLEVIS